MDNIREGVEVSTGETGCLRSDDIKKREPDEAVDSIVIAALERTVYIVWSKKNNTAITEGMEAKASVVGIEEVAGRRGRASERLNWPHTRACLWIWRARNVLVWIYDTATVGSILWGVVKAEEREY
jgi:hypothetical protein